ncbi:PKD domain-containing protein [Spirosoma utsteinense]|uniref:Gliding motility-associated-like protein n=1 Tax=Spirosoma utsteinense TaxID=2585773 RepID=A0ABR6W0Q7_9BACT|nr:PKD domain-containing protein [Spirosoma utsteinense]MBC3783693.1 gliding motility-associated-like protein [Spirosoma utsteinense]MBC3790164.1 gliding motility-associated-like protein [Spirosoma utsteinense]
MLTSRSHTYFIGIWAMLFMLAGLSEAYSQAPVPSFQISGKTCVPDQECKADSITFTDSSLTGVTTRLWDFGDGSTVTTQGNAIARHVYQQQGSYEIRLTRTIGGITQPVTEPVSVTIYPRPQPFINWKTDTTICTGEAITLNPYASGPPQSGLRFLWYPKGDTTQTIQVDSSGCYSVEAIDPNGCTYQDRINVDVCGEKKESQGVKWYFGQNAGLDFSGGGTPAPITDGNLSTIEGSSSIANTKGILLFYTDGVTIFDKDGTPLKSLVPGDTATVQTPLGGNKNSTQSALIVPKPTCRGCEYLYYVYTTAEIRGQKRLTYSVVDMRQNGGKGAIVEKNVPVSSQGTEQSASVRNDRDSTYWVITRVFGTNRFEIRHLTSSETPTLTTYEGGQKIDSLSQAEGYIKIGPADTTGGNEGNRPMAVVIPGPPQNSVDLYTFNDSTGKMTFNRTLQLGPAPPKAYGVEFSPDGESLYVTMLADTNADGSQKGASYIVKYDLNQRDSLLASSRTVVDSSTTRQYGSVQIGPDGRLYVAIQGSSSLGTIENPNGGLLDSLIFNPNGQSLGGKNSQLGLPNLVANFNDNSSGPGIAYGDTCANQPTVFQISPNCPKLKETYTLTFGDGSRPVSTTALQPITHTYTQKGEYLISLRIVTQLSNGRGICKDTTIFDTLNIVETPPDINLGADTAICNKRGITLDLKVEATVYVWLIGGRVVSREKTLKLDRPGYYLVVGLAANGGCFKSDTIEVQIKPVPSLDLGPDTLFCYRSSVTLRVPQQTWNQFAWSNGGTERTTSVSVAGTYSVTATNSSGCENSDTIRVRELPKVVLRAALTPPTACTSSDGVIELTPTPAGIYLYTWTQGDGAILPSNTNRQSNLPEGAYRISATDSVYGCKADTSFALRSPQNTLALTPQVKDALCSIPNSGTISLNVSGGTATGYTWLDQNNNPIATTPVFDRAAPGLYTVQITDARGCKALLDSIRVGLDSTGFARLGPDQLKCVGDSVLLATLDGDQPGNVYLWNTNATTPTIYVAQTGTYNLVVRNTQTGCVGRSTVQVADRPVPTFAFTREASVCEGDQGRVQLSASGGSGLRYLWLPRNDTTQSITVSQAGQYGIRVTDPQGCTATGVARVLDLCEPRVNIPDAFTPNNDGLNDDLQVFTAYVSDYEFRIYNRWGEVIFVSTNPEQKWDGMYRGEAYPSMLYPYVISYKSESFPDRKRVIKQGSVLLIR